MKWPWKLKPIERADHEPEEMTGAQAHIEAMAGLEDTRARTPEVHRVSRSLRELRERNGFFELIEGAIQGGRQ
jgi:hypothetical protein